MSELLVCQSVFLVTLLEMVIMSLKLLLITCRVLISCLLFYLYSFGKHQIILFIPETNNVISYGGKLTGTCYLFWNRDISNWLMTGYYSTWRSCLVEELWIIKSFLSAFLFLISNHQQKKSIDDFWAVYGENKELSYRKFSK